MDRPKDVQAVRELQSEKLNELYKELTVMFNYQLQYGITYLAEKGVNVGVMADAFGLTTARIYKIIDKVRKEYDGESEG